MTVAYLDASAIVKLVLHEVESPVLLRWYVEAERAVTSRVGVVETRRAIRRKDHDPVRLDTVIDGLEVFELDADIEGRASSVQPVTLRALDAIHIATAIAIVGLDSFVTYDDRQADAARALGLPVFRPA